MFSGDIPDISSQDVALIKKTAFYTLQYPWFKTNHKFSRKGHSLYPYYCQLKEQYRLLLNGPPEPTPPSEVLTRAHQLAQERVQKQEQLQQDQIDQEKERLAFAQIDWQDFTVLQTIKFSARDLNEDLPLPLSPEQISQTPLAERGNIIDNLVAKKDVYIISPFTGQKIKSSEYDRHVKVMNFKGKSQDQASKLDSASNLHYEDVEENLKNWKKVKLD